MFLFLKDYLIIIFILKSWLYKLRLYRGRVRKTWTFHSKVTKDTGSNKETLKSSKTIFRGTVDTATRRHTLYSKTLPMKVLIKIKKSSNYYYTDPYKRKHKKDTFIWKLRNIESGLNLLKLIKIYLLKKTLWKSKWFFNVCIISLKG